MLTLRLVTLLAIFFTVPAMAGAAQKENITLIHAGTLLAVPGQKAQDKQSVIIKDGKVSAISAGFVSASDFPEAASVQTIDLRDKFVMPGMMDMHVHLTLDNRNNRGELHKTTDAGFAMLAVENADLTLMAGITTIRDLAAVSSEAIIAVRDAIDAGVVPGPRIISAGQALSATAGHADHFGGREDYAQLYHSSGVCDGADDCRRAVRDQYKIGADMIKIMATGGGADRNGKKHSKAEMFDDELVAIVEAAHRLDLKVTAHAHGTDGINAALKAGVDSIEHSSYMDDTSIKLYRKNGAHLVATASLPTYFQQSPDIPDSVKAMLRGKAKEVDVLLGKAHRAGVTLSMGSDAGISNHGSNAEELVAYVNIGMTPMEALQTATTNAAELIGLSDKIGSLAAGKIADIIAFDQNPLIDITAVRNVSFVMRNGITYKHP